MSAPLFLRAWRPGDEAAFKPRDDFAQDMANNAHDWGSGPPPGIVWTVVRRNGRIEGVAGAMIAGQGELHVWACLADLGPRDLARCITLAREELAKLAAQRWTRRIIAEARLEDPAAIRCLERLGFNSDGRQRRVGEALYVRMRRGA